MLFPASPVTHHVTTPYPTIITSFIASYHISPYLKVLLNCIIRKPDIAYAKTKAQISFAVTVKLISSFVFATWIV